MRMQNFRIICSAALFFGVVGGLFAQNPAANGRRGYATDYFDGFSALDEDSRIPQKEKSFWYSVSEKDAASQLAYAQRMEKEGSFRAARKGYEALVREWPATKEALQAQLNLSAMFEREGKYEKAFDEYQYTIVHFAGNCPYYQILDRQFRIANSLLHNNKSMFGWTLSGLSPIREKFEQIVRNAPRSTKAAEAMLIIGGIREQETELKEAIQVYDGLLNRFPASEQADVAAYRSARCRYVLAKEEVDHEPRCREALAFLKALLARRPNHAQKSDLLAWQKELNALLVEQNYRATVFYDSKVRSVKPAKEAYKNFLREFGDSKYAPQVKQRLAELERGAPPLK